MHSRLWDPEPEGRRGGRAQAPSQRPQHLLQGNYMWAFWGFGATERYTEKPKFRVITAFAIGLAFESFTQTRTPWNWLWPLRPFDKATLQTSAPRVGTASQAPRTQQAERRGVPGPSRTGE